MIEHIINFLLQPSFIIVFLAYFVLMALCFGFIKDLCVALESIGIILNNNARKKWRKLLLSGLFLFFVFFVFLHLFLQVSMN